MQGISLITCTRNRKFNFRLLEEYRRRQTLRCPWQWLVINDGIEEYAYTYGQQVIVRDPIEEREIQIGSVRHSVCHNLLLAIPQIMFEKIVIWDDDDWFHPEYLWRIDLELEFADLVGFAPALYWNLEHKEAANLGNDEHASLTCTGFRRNVLPLVEEIARRGDPFVDWALWREWSGSRRLVPNKATDGRAIQVGLKGTGTMGGRQIGNPGVGAGHLPGQQGKGFPDPTGEKLRRWIGAEDAKIYHLTANQ